MLLFCNSSSSQLIFLVWCSMKNSISRSCLQETEGKPSMSRNRWVGICSQRYSCHCDKGGGGMNSLLRHHCPQLPSCHLFQWQGQEPIMPLHLPSLQITRLYGPPISTRLAEGKSKKKSDGTVWPVSEPQWCPDLFSWQQHISRFSTETPFQFLLHHETIIWLYKVLAGGAMERNYRILHRFGAEVEDWRRQHWQHFSHFAFIPSSTLTISRWLGPVNNDAAERNSINTKLQAISKVCTCQEHPLDSPLHPPLSPLQSLQDSNGANC